MSPNQDHVLDALSKVMDPELGRDLVSLGMIKDIIVQNGSVAVTVELTTPACPLKNKIESDVKNAILSLPGVENVTVNLTSKVPADKQIKEKIELDIRTLSQLHQEKEGWENRLWRLTWR